MTAPPICPEKCDHDVRCEGVHEKAGEHWAWTRADRELHVWTADRPCDCECDCGCHA